jgi:hypothetical protein
MGPAGAGAAVVVDWLLVFLWAGSVLAGFLGGLLVGYRVGRSEGDNGGGGNGEGERVSRAAL